MNKTLDFGNKCINKVIKKSKEYLGEDLYNILQEEGLEWIKGTIPTSSMIINYSARLQEKKLKKFIKKIYDDKTTNPNFNCDDDFIEKLFVVIDRIDFEEKIDYMAELYAMLTRGEVTNAQFFRGCKILDNISLIDLNTFSEKDYYEVAIDDGSLYLMLGLLENKYPKQGEPIKVKDMGALKLSTMGEIFLKIKNKLNI